MTYLCRNVHAALPWMFLIPSCSAFFEWCTISCNLFIQACRNTMHAPTTFFGHVYHLTARTMMCTWHPDACITYTFTSILAVPVSGISPPVCVHSCWYVCIHLCVHAMSRFICVCMCVSVHLPCTIAHSCVCMYVLMCLCIYAHMYACMHVSTVLHRLCMYVCHAPGTFIHPCAFMVCSTLYITCMCVGARARLCVCVNHCMHAPCNISPCTLQYIAMHPAIYRHAPCNISPCTLQYIAYRRVYVSYSYTYT